MLNHAYENSFRGHLLDLLLIYYVNAVSSKARSSVPVRISVVFRRQGFFRSNEGRGHSDIA